MPVFGLFTYLFFIVCYFAKGTFRTRFNVLMEMEIKENIIQNVVYDTDGVFIRNENNHILCEIIDDGEVCTAFLPSTLLQECGLIQEETEKVVAVQNANSLVQSLTSVSSPEHLSVHQTCQIWKTSKTQTQKDQEATLYLLQLRKTFEKEFVDKKTAKNVIWMKIATDMNNMGFYVGEGVEGREKVRQKFVKLQSSYQKYQQKRRQTGEGAVAKPPYFEELDDILGEEHKICPPVIIDSEKQSPDNDKNDASTEENKGVTPSSSTEALPGPSKNRFTTIRKTTRPQKDRVLDVLKEIHRENMEQRKQEFNTLVELMREENTQRHTEIMAILNSKKKKIWEKRESESESD